MASSSLVTPMKMRTSNSWINNIFDWLQLRGTFAQWINPLRLISSVNKGFRRHTLPIPSGSTRIQYTRCSVPLYICLRLHCAARTPEYGLCVSYAVPPALRVHTSLRGYAIYTSVIQGIPVRDSSAVCFSVRPAERYCNKFLVKLNWRIFGSTTYCY